MSIVGTHDVVFITLDTLRYDVACRAHLPCLRAHLPGGQWEARHSPASFTYAAHQAFFAGFLPTPIAPGKHPRLFAARFQGSETTTTTTHVFDTPDIVTGFAAAGYHTACIGGVGFFNPINPLGRVLPGLFAESHWDASLGVADPRSTEHQIGRALAVIRRTPAAQRLFLFINISAIHQPNYFYLPGTTEDTLASHQAALEYVDSCLPPLIAALRRPTFVIVCSDHGTAYGEDGYSGHRIGHSVVWTVPYAEFFVR